MAGIGFSLKKLFNRQGIINLCRAYGYAGIITTGPMLLGVALLVGVSFAARLGGMSSHDRELLNCMLTYSLLASLSVTSIFNMGLTRYISDMLYEEKNDKVMPSFFGAAAVMLVICCCTYGVFLLFSGVRLIYKLLCLYFALVLIVVWTQNIYLTALKDYKAIVLAFAISLMIGFLVILICILVGIVSIEAFMLGIILAYGILMCRFMSLMLDYFPQKSGSNYSFLRWLSRYRRLVISGIMINIGLFSHLIIMYFGPLRVQVEGLFYGAPEYDVPALIAFFNLLITTINFVTSVEVRFYPKYRNYYGLFNDQGSIYDIEQAEHEMLTVLRQELTFSGHKQLFTSILFIVLIPPLLELVNMPLSSLSLTIFRYLCVGYGTYAVANSTMLILLYFEDYTGAMLGCTAFGVLATACTVWQILFSETIYFGIGFFVGAIIFYLIVVFRLDYYTKKLPYYLLARQSMTAVRDHGLMAWIAEKLDERQDRIAAEQAAQAAQKAEEYAAKEGITA